MIKKPDCNIEDAKSPWSAVTNVSEYRERGSKTKNAVIQPFIQVVHAIHNLRNGVRLTRCRIT
ncbi:hypothetical protein SAMN05216387_106124 [Nitrosovibrio tenuis]|uniref:Uncharacterized protein n=1 Tax=Nitrosovibrio tenuis TaxID=1233 RepID=A0A1H7NBU5_9PROT|nr:hypothetical protein SAMN05216387_106124 [Nitrosovibrio tenuis]